MPKTIELVISTQAGLEREIAGFLREPAERRELRIVPMRGTVDLEDLISDPMLSSSPDQYVPDIIPGIARVTVAGGSEPLKTWDARRVRDQCIAAGVEFVFLSYGDWVDAWNPVMKEEPILPLMDRGMHGCFDSDGNWRLDEGPCSRYENRDPMYYRVGSSRSGRMLDGRTHDAQKGEAT